MQMLSSRQFAAIATIIEYLYEHLDQQTKLRRCRYIYEFKSELYPAAVPRMGRH